MEGFELISSGAWSILPPLLALGLALITKEVYSALTIGVFSGMVIYQFTLDGIGFQQLIAAFAMVPNMMATQIANNGALLLFLALLGSLTVVISLAGGSRAYAEWVTKHIKNARVAQLMTAILGILLFVDDYFNCLTVGAVMRPVTDRFGVSHEKLAWLIDSTAAPICIIAPVSSWAVAVGGYLGENGFNTFVQSIPYNFYALLTIIFVVLMCITERDFGPMKTAQEEYGLPVEELQHLPGDANLLAAAAANRRNPEDLNKSRPSIPTVVAEAAEVPIEGSTALEEYKGLNISDKGSTWDLVIPIVVLIIFSIAGMLYTGGFFEGVEFAEAVGVDPVAGLCIGVCVALVVAFALFIPRQIMNIEGFVGGVSEGVRSMIGAIMILILAWSLGGCCRYLLGTGEFVSGLLTNLGIDLTLLPAVIFVTAAFIGFAMGTSWGTIALLLPIVLGVFAPDSPEFLLAIGATLGGSVYGDHVSPISDTTILSSAGAECNHLRHVATQLPYASLVMLVSLVGYVIGAFLDNVWLTLGICAVLMIAVTLVLPSLSNKKAQAA